MSAEKTIRVLKIEPQKEPYVKEIVCDQHSVQAEVEGHAFCLPLEDGCIAVVNDERKTNDLKPNRWLRGDIIAGPFFICRGNWKGNFASLTDGQVSRYSSRFADSQQFTGTEPEAEPRMTFGSL